MSRRRSILRSANAALAGLLGLVVVVSATFAGQRYLYCNAMQRVMTHSCCERADTRQAQGQRAAVAVIEAECCQSRANASAGVFVPAARSHDLTAPFVATVARTPLLLAAIAEARASKRDLGMRTGPPLSRALAQLMVFRI